MFALEGDHMTDFYFSNVTWIQFDLCNDNQTEAFEDMCWELFHIVILKEADVPHSDHNNPGVEVYPILEPVREDGKPQRRVSFQAKYFRKNVSYKQIKESLIQAVSKYKNELDHIYLFCNQTLTKTTKGYKELEEIVTNAGMTMQPVSNKDILNLIKNHPDVAKYYFSQRKIVDLNLYDRLMERYSDQYSVHPSIKMMTPDPMLFPSGLPAITNAERRTNEGNREPSSIKEMILKSWQNPERKHILLVGEGGIGKTVAMLMLPKEEWFLNYKIPVIYVPLQKLDAFEGNLNDYIRNEYGNELRGINELSAYAWTGHPNIIILLDGFNEIPMKYKQTAEKHILLWMDKPGVQIITTSRISFSLNRRFLEYTLLPLPYETIRKYLLSAGIDEINLPSQNDYIWKVINVPLMLTMFIQIDKVKERTMESYISDYLQWKESDSAAHIIWNYLQVELYRLISTNASTGVSTSVAILAVGPFVCFEMADSRLFYVEQKVFIEFLRKAVDFFSQYQKMLPEQINIISNNLDPFSKEKPFDESRVEDYYRILSEQSVLFQKNVNIDENRKAEIVYTPAHQNFRDALAAVFISECMLNCIKEKKKPIIPDVSLNVMDLYVKNYISEFLSDEELLAIWDYHRRNDPENGRVTWTLMDILGRTRHYDFSELNFSGLDLSKINLHRLLSKRMDICPLPKRAELFNETRISLRNLTPEGHIGTVTNVSFSPNGRKLASSSYDYTVRIWDLESGNSQVLEGHIYATSSVAFSLDGILLASGSEDNTVRVWNLENGKNKVLEGHSGVVNSVSFSPDGRQLASGSSDMTIRVWDLDSGNSQVLEEHSGAVRSVSFGPNGGQLASGSDDNTVKIWNLKNGTCRILKGHMQAVCCVVFSPDGKLLASSSKDQTVRLWNLKSGKSHMIKGHSGAINSVSFSPDGRYLASGSDDGTVQVRDLRSGTDRVLKGHSGVVNGVSFSPNGRQLASSSLDKTIRVWDLESGKSQVIEGHSSWVRCVSFSPDRRQLAISSHDKTIRIINLKNGSSQVLEGHSGWVNFVSFSPDGRQLASGSYDKTIRIWDLKSGNSRVLKGHSDGVNSVLFSPDGKRLASGSHDKTIRIWELKNDKNKVLKGHSGGINTISFSPDGRQLASGSKDNTIRVWDLKSGSSRVLEGHWDWVKSVSFKSDGKQLASGSYDKTIRIWDLESGNSQVLERHSGGVNSISFSPDGKWIASGSNDSMVCVWDVDTRIMIKKYRIICNINLNGINLKNAIIPKEDVTMFKEVGAKI